MDRPEIVAKYKRKGFVSVADVLRSEGEAVGLAKGRSEGEAAGLVKGRSEGEAAGLVKGKLVALVQSAKNFLAMGLSLEQVSQGTGLSVEEIRRNCL